MRHAGKLLHRERAFQKPLRQALRRLGRKLAFSCARPSAFFSRINPKNAFLRRAHQLDIHHIEPVRGGYPLRRPPISSKLTAIVPTPRKPFAGRGPSLLRTQALDSIGYDVATPACASREFAPNKKWAVSPLISPPAGVTRDNRRTNSSAWSEYCETPGNSTRLPWRLTLRPRQGPDGRDGFSLVVQ